VEFGGDGIAVNEQALIIMAKRPIPGRTKTRLVPPLTEEQAAELYTYFLRDALELARSLPQVTPFIAYTPADEHTAAYFRDFAPDFQLISQVGTTLGERLDHVISHCLHAGFNPVAAMNSDSPTLPAAFVHDGFSRLAAPDVDLILGPCQDGGYYLIGVKKPPSRVVRDVQMSTDQVLIDTLQIAAEEALKVQLLPPWFDVDSMDDLQRLRSTSAYAQASGLHTRRYLESRVHRTMKGMPPGTIRK
jgi:rSAM/selenodomain-associated transferase 1